MSEFEIVVLVVCAFWIGYKIGFIRAARRVALNLVEDPERMKRLFTELAKIREEVEREERGEEPTQMGEIEVHKEQNQYYLYRKSNNQFLAQGPTLKEALDAVGKRFPNETFAGVIPKDQVEQWGLNKEV